jgi:hypothetical protein
LILESLLIRVTTTKKNKLLNVKINLQKVTLHDGGVANQLLAAAKPTLPPACLGQRQPNA